MENYGIESAVFQNLESSEKERIFKIAMEEFRIFVWKNSEIILKWMHLSVILSTVYVKFVNVTIYNTKHNPSKKFKIYCQKYHFSIFIGFQNANEIEFHGFEI